MFISLDAQWGSGKTFYVRQVEQTLNYLTKKRKGLEIEDDVEKAFSKNKRLCSLDLSHTYFPVYYNAWLYDNHNDPLLSLMFIISKICECYCDSKMGNNTLSEKMLSLLDSFSFSVGGFLLGSNFESVREKFRRKDILSDIKTEEDIRNKVKEIFDSIIVENVQKLVIFLDELDRCRPSFAIEMLERIKHYFDDDRIIFVVSINREQLIHVISNYYGTNFDSTGYLDKFFDWNIFLPELDTRFDKSLDFTNGQYYIERITKELSLYYHLSHREKLRYNQCISSVILSNNINDYSGEGIILSAFVSIIAVLNIKDEINKKKFLQGNSNVLEELFHNIQIFYKMACRFGTYDGRESEENFKVGFTKIKEVYDYAFGTGEKARYNGAIEIGDNLKKICLRICSGLEIEKNTI